MSKIDMEQLKQLAESFNKYGYKASVVALIVVFLFSYFQISGLQSQINQPVASVITAMQKEASYIVGASGSTYWLMNGTGDRAGRVEWTSTNASAVFLNAIGNLTTNPISIAGGKISVVGSQNAPFYFNSNVTIVAPQITIEGIGSYTPKLVANATDVTIFDVQRHTAGGEANYGINILNMFFDGASQTTRPLINFNDTQLCSVRNCFIEKGGYGIKAANTETLRVIDNHFEAQVYSAILLWDNTRNCEVIGGDSYQGAIGIEFNRVSDSPYSNTIIGFSARLATNTGIWITGHKNTIIGCTSDQNAIYGLVLQGDNNNVNGGFYGNMAGSGQDWGIYISAGKDSNIIMGCQTLANSVGGIYNGGTNTHVYAYNGTVWVAS